MIGFPKPMRIINERLVQSVREMPCAVCYSSAPSDPSHIKTRKSGGYDSAFNVFPMCRPCHTLWHLDGPRTFLRNHPQFLDRLRMVGWYVDPFTHRLWHPEFQ